MAKKKSKTVRRAKAVRTARAGARRAAGSARCQRLREQLMELDQEIAGVREDLGDPDIPAGIKARLRVILRQLLATRTRVLRALEACERVPQPPSR
jgi:hypothetical protein